MVRNKTGGKNHKKMASKNEKVFINKKIPLIKTSNDKNMLLYGIVEKPLGQGRFEIKCSDGKIRLLELRRKFSGRNKRDNRVNINTIVLAGKREWQVVNDTKKKEKVDLIYVYNENDLPKLKKDVEYFDSHILLGDITDETDNGFDFSNNNDIVINNTKISNTKNKEEEEETDEFDNFDFDDI